jgi:hypothetical protein
VAKKNKDRIKTDIEISYLIAEDAFRKITDNQKTYRGGLDLSVFSHTRAKTQFTHELASLARRGGAEKVDEYYLSARRLFNEISENLSPETAASIFRFTMKKRKRGKSYDPVLEMALRLHARVNSSHETARLAHETYRIGNSVGALQRHIQRLLAKSDDSRDK